MKKETPLILLSNDDGVTAKGINELVDMLRPIGDLVVMAPDSPRSGSSGAITAHAPVCFDLVRKEEGLTVYKCTGTPVDCVKLALETVVPRTPDLIIGGINHGDNSAVNVHYSGTMGIVLEGCMKGIPSIGYSLCRFEPDADFSPTASYVQRITQQVLSNGLPKGVCLNVNFPSDAPYKGVKVCRQNYGRWEREWCKCEHPRGENDLYWITGKFVNYEPEKKDTDNWALNNGYVSITPTQVDLTAYEMINKMNSWDLF